MALTLVVSITDSTPVMYPESVFAANLTAVTSPHTVEHLVVVNGDDAYPHVAHDLPNHAHVVESSQYLGVGAARGLGLGAARDMGAEFVVFVDDDVIVPWEVDWLSHLLSPFACGRVMATGPFPVVSEDDFTAAWYTRDPRAAHYLDAPFALRVGVATDLGGFDSTWVTGGERQALMLKGAVYGLSILGVAGSGISHYRGQTTGGTDYHFARDLDTLRKSEGDELRRRFPAGWGRRIRRGIDRSHTVDRLVTSISVDPRRGDFIR